MKVLEEYIKKAMEECEPVSEAKGKSMAEIALGFLDKDVKKIEKILREMDKTLKKYYKPGDPELIGDKGRKMGAYDFFMHSVETKINELNRTIYM